MTTPKTDDGIEPPKGAKPLTWIRALRERACRACGKPYLQHRHEDHAFDDPLSKPKVVSASAALAIALALATLARGSTSEKLGPEGSLFVSQLDLAFLSGTSESTVRRVTAHLISSGFLARTHTGSAVKGDASTYVLTLKGDSESPTKASEQDRLEFDQGDDDDGEPPW